jgi:sugar (pentulose or hexulose) kinase
MSIHQYLDALAENRPAGSDGLIFLPYFLGRKPRYMIRMPVAFSLA